MSLNTVVWITPTTNYFLSSVTLLPRLWTCLFLDTTTIWPQLLQCVITLGNTLCFLPQPGHFQEIGIISFMNFIIAYSLLTNHNTVTGTVTTLSNLVLLADLSLNCLRRYLDWLCCIKLTYYIIPPVICFVKGICVSCYPLFLALRYRVTRSFYSF